MSQWKNRFVGLGLTIGSVVIISACAQSGSPASPSPFASSATSVVRQAELRRVEVCKDYVNVVGPTVTINVAQDNGNNGSVDANFSIQLANGQCQEIADNAPTGAVGYTITEVVPAGFTASTVTTSINGSGVVTVGPSVAGNSTSGFIGDGGFLVVFTNTAPIPPPPGGEGCTPGYWKQEQHFDSWTAPYTPNTLFSAVFENAFPGMTLLQVLEQGGGGLKALGRHTVAALLNAQSNGVAYPLTTAQVIAGFNAVFPGGDYETLHLRWAAFNEAGCTLN